MKIGLIKEGKTPSDTRVALTPRQCDFIQRNFPIQIIVEPSALRSFKDDEYRALGIRVHADLSDCDILLGIKEVPIAQLMPNKRYYFFSHTIKKQVYNRPLLQAILEKNIELIDYEVLTNEIGGRLIAFGKFAGMVGAHNGILAYGIRTGAFSLPRMKDLHDYAEARAHYSNLDFPPMRIVLTGTGRVATGAAEVLDDCAIVRVTPKEYLHEHFDHAVYTQLKPEYYVAPKNGDVYQKAEFYAHPEQYKSIFARFYRQTDLFINGIFYNKQAPAFFTVEEMTALDFQIQVIADVSCDMVPDSSVPATIKASTIEVPFFGFHKNTGEETTAFDPNGVTMMTIDNLPNELPRDASSWFGDQFIANVLPEILKGADSDVLARGRVAINGKLTEKFAYLQDFVKVMSVS
jgi:saccharopine dehydrogenase (NAD+, L-lysine forming)